MADRGTTLRTVQGNGGGNGASDSRRNGRNDRIGWLLACALSCATTALAQTPGAQNRQPVPATAPPHVSAPLSSPAAQDARPFGPEYCDSFVPSAAVIPANIGPTLFAYTSTLSGDVRDVDLFRSSGSPEFDKAALACASAWHGRPLTVAGKSAEIRWMGMVTWNGRWHQLFTDASPDGLARSCLSYYPPIAVRLNHEGTTSVRFHVATDGSVKDLFVSQSSSHSELDNATLQCVVSWKYFPATQNGQPVELDRDHSLTWQEN